MGHRLVWLALVCACKSSSHAMDANEVGHVKVNILAFNDFHGALDPPATGIGGAAYLAADIASLRTPNTLVVSAGDLIGASPLVSGLFHDEPTIDVMNAIGLDLASVGNHEFDEGTAELHRMQNGGCHPIDGCQASATFDGATFHYLAANVLDTTTGQTVFPPYEIRNVGGANIAIVGMTLQDTPAVTLASAIPELTFGEEAATMAALLPDIHAHGANIVVLVIHQGASNAAAPDGCFGVSGPILDIADQLDPSVVLVASGHTHTIYNCTRSDGRLVTNAGFYGEYITQAILDVDVATQTVTSATAHNLPVTGDVTPDPIVAGMVAHYDQLAAPVGDRVIGTITADLGATSSAGEVVMGDVIADAMLDATTAQVALMNPGGIRASLLYAKSNNETVDGQVTYAEAFGVQPFSNLVETADLDGASLVAALDYWSSNDVLQVAGLSYTWHALAAPGSRVTAADVLVGGVPLDPAQTYRITVNSIVADHPGLETAANVTGDGVDLDLLVGYFGAHSPISPPPANRIAVAP